jgi:diguanylate cyclase (GGDEF)-like protein
MPEMDGFSLIRKIRSQKSAHELPIIGMSGHFNKNLSAHFMKCGANDYMGKPFSPDEFYCRITQNLEMAKYIREIRDAAFHDFLTGLQNRHYFWKFAPQMCDNARKDGAFLALALIDVDFFKHVNDTYNHEAGDAVLKWIGNTMTAYFGPETIFARFGGEEFCVLFPTPDEEYAFSIMDRFRETVAAQIIHYQQLSLSITVSIGICVSKEYSPERMIECADNAMYQAKNSGRNRCVTHHQEDS